MLLDLLMSAIRRSPTKLFDLSLLRLLLLLLQNSFLIRLSRVQPVFAVKTLFMLLISILKRDTTVLIRGTCTSPTINLLCSCFAKCFSDRQICVGSLFLFSSQNSHQNLLQSTASFLVSIMNLFKEKEGKTHLPHAALCLVGNIFLKFGVVFNLICLFARFQLRSRSCTNYFNDGVKVSIATKKCCPYYLSISLRSFTHSKVYEEKKTDLQRKNHVLEQGHGGVHDYKEHVRMPRHFSGQNEESERR